MKARHSNGASHYGQRYPRGNSFHGLRMIRPPMTHLRMGSGEEVPVSEEEHLFSDAFQAAVNSPFDDASHEFSRLRTPLLTIQQGASHDVQKHARWNIFVIQKSRFLYLFLAATYALVGLADIQSNPEPFSSDVGKR